MRRYAQKGDYKPLPKSPCLNLVTAVIDFYKRQPPPKRLKTIFLDHKHWSLLVEELKRIDDSYVASATAGVEIDGCDVTVKRGSQFQNKEMKYEFYPVVPQVISKEMAQA